MGKKVFLLLGIFLIISLFLPNTSFASGEYCSGSSAVLASYEIQQKKDDNRTDILKRYLTYRNSPLVDSADTFVKSADTNKLDWKFVAAISGVESTFGQHIPSHSYNAWGWGIYGTNMIMFRSYDEAIETISKGLKERYIDGWGAETVYEIGRYYAASPTWASRVSFFMNDIEEFALKTPTTNLSLSI